MHKTAIVFMLFFSLVSCALSAGTLKNRVNIPIPSSWKLINSKNSDKLVANVYYIRTDKIGVDSHYSNALVQYYTVPASGTIDQADNIVAHHTKGATFVLSAQDGPHWRTYLLVRYEGKQQYIIFYRIGIVDGVCLEVMLAFPHITGEKNTPPTHVLTLNEEYVKDKKMAGVFCKPSAVREMVDAFNALCEKLRISGVGEFKADVRIVEQPGNAIEKIYRYEAESDSKNQ